MSHSPVTLLWFCAFFAAKHKAAELGQPRKDRSTYSPAKHHKPKNDSVSQTAACLNARAWLDDLVAQPAWSNFSQGDQDSVLDSLFSQAHLGTTNKYFVEFGFPSTSFVGSAGNGHYLWSHLGFKNYALFDGNKKSLLIHLHRAFITADNVVQTFKHFAVPLEPDYVSIDIDSCDIWVFRALTSEFRPRVVTVEYNSKYPLGDFTALGCKDPAAYSFKGDDLYGASLSAIELAGRRRGYSLVYATPTLDLFFVRDDLLCPGTAVPAAAFSAATRLALHPPYQGDRAELLLDFRAWLERT
eukprot:CAMPEP_0168413540 /NCGR_PEP_ID=MMETSP0228-20121227/29271_1 /TAXON_ID=133427 /ORGANISM="Protoceratium reticulatum, Strain CCCM 535 (=CCMP 1889)" /LENGTH=298 /DNA_ID=CAMNT_0008427325 /DNA_START=51 /DNA_END=944 /DNA_ORIENTATION=+